MKSLSSMLPGPGIQPKHSGDLFTEIRDTCFKAGIHAVIADQKHPQGVWTQSYDDEDYEKKVLTRMLLELEWYKKGKPKGFKMRGIQYTRRPRRIRKSRKR